MKSVDVVDVIREVGDLESQVVSGLVGASDGGGVHVLVAFHVGRFRLFKQHDSIKVAYATATVGRGKDVSRWESQYCGQVAPSKLPARHCGRSP